MDQVWTRFAFCPKFSVNRLLQEPSEGQKVPFEPEASRKSKWVHIVFAKPATIGTFAKLAGLSDPKPGPEALPGRKAVQGRVD